MRSHAVRGPLCYDLASLLRDSFPHLVIVGGTKMPGSGLDMLGLAGSTATQLH